jgi:hypothetical protein
MINSRFYSGRSTEIKSAIKINGMKGTLKISRLSSK